MTDLHRLSIREMAEGLKSAQFSSRELTQHYLNRIAKIDDRVNSYITVTAEQALAQADAAVLEGFNLKEHKQSVRLLQIPQAAKNACQCQFYYET